MSINKTILIGRLGESDRTTIKASHDYILQQMMASDVLAKFKSQQQMVISDVLAKFKSQQMIKSDVLAQFKSQQQMVTSDVLAQFKSQQQMVISDVLAKFKSQQQMMASDRMFTKGFIEFADSAKYVGVFSQFARGKYDDSFQKIETLKNELPLTKPSVIENKPVIPIPASEPLPPLIQDIEEQSEQQIISQYMSQIGKKGNATRGATKRKIIAHFQREHAETNISKNQFADKYHATYHRTRDTVRNILKGI